MQHLNRNPVGKNRETASNNQSILSCWRGTSSWTQILLKRTLSDKQEQLTLQFPRHSFPQKGQPAFIFIAEDFLSDQDSRKHQQTWRSGVEIWSWIRMQDTPPCWSMTVNASSPRAHTHKDAHTYTHFSLLQQGVAEGVSFLCLIRAIALWRCTPNGLGKRAHYTFSLCKVPETKIMCMWCCPLAWYTWRAATCLKQMTWSSESCEGLVGTTCISQ